jgi:hypothetical protein
LAKQIISIIASIKKTFISKLKPRMLFQVLTCLFVASVHGYTNRGLAPIEYDLDGFHVTITGNGNVPKYTYYSDEYPESKYKVMFQQIYESKNGQKIGNSLVSLPSLGWEVDDESATVFWWNATDDKIGHIAFRNELFNGTLKFDVILDNYEWKSTDSDALNLVFKMTNSSQNGTGRLLQDIGVEGEPATKEPTKLCYYGSGGTNEGQVCFLIVDTATAATLNADGNTTSKDVKVTLDYEGGTGIKVTYARFEGNLTHDPSFGYAVEEEMGFFARFFAMFKSFFSKIFFFL